MRFHGENIHIAEVCIQIEVFFTPMKTITDLKSSCWFGQVNINTSVTTHMRYTMINIHLGWHWQRKYSVYSNIRMQEGMDINYFCLCFQLTSCEELKWIKNGSASTKWWKLSKSTNLIKKNILGSYCVFRVVRPVQRADSNIDMRKLYPHAKIWLSIEFVEIDQNL